MMTATLPQFSPTRLSESDANLPAKLDLLNSLTAAEDIVDYPADRNVRRWARQIQEDCAGLEFICFQVRRILASKQPEIRVDAASQIVAELQRVLGDQDSPSPVVPPALILDLETVRAVRPKDPAQVKPGVEYVERWPQTDDERRAMGIACVAVQRSDAGADVGEIDGSNDYDMQILADACTSAPLIVTFGGDGFDLPMLRAHGIHHLPKSYDLRTGLREALGLKPQDRSGFGLTDWAKANGCGEKSFDAVTAPERWQRNGPGDRESVRRDCANDVMITAGLFRLICAQGYLSHPATGERVSVAGPVEVEQ